MEKNFQKNLHRVITLSAHIILVTSSISETPCIYRILFSVFSSHHELRYTRIGHMVILIRSSQFLTSHVSNNH